MKRCTTCGNRYNDEMQFCIEDRTALVAARHDQQAETLQIEGMDDSWMREILLPDESGIVTLKMSQTATVLGVYLQPAPPDNQLHPFLCVRVRDRMSGGNRRFLLAGHLEWVRGAYVGSFLSIHGYLLHVFEVEAEDQ